MQYADKSPVALLQGCIWRDSYFHKNHSNIFLDVIFKFNNSTVLSALPGVGPRCLSTGCDAIQDTFMAVEEPMKPHILPEEQPEAKINTLFICSSTKIPSIFGQLKPTKPTWFYYSTLFKFGN